MEYIVHNLRIGLDGNGSVLPSLAARKIGCGVEHVRSLRVVRRSFDARPDRLEWVYSVVVDLKSKGAYLLRRRRPGGDVRPWTPPLPPASEPGTLPFEHGGPVIVGSGPAGMFAALLLAECGYKPLLLERGPEMDARDAAVEALVDERRFDPEANFLFGEGGAGTYSDGKLYSRGGDELAGWVIERFVEFGADPDVAIEARPHVGSDRLGWICRRIRERIEQRGGRCRFGTRVEGFELRDGRLEALRLAGGECIALDCCVLAIGHSARDTFAALARDGVALEAKTFQMGLRIEHPQDYIDRLQLGDLAVRPDLTPADYHLVARGAAGDGDVYSFCMCPGGAVLPAAHQRETICSNGGSRARRDSGYANAALVMAVRPDHYGEAPGEAPGEAAGVLGVAEGAGVAGVAGVASVDPLAGLAFQEAIERACFAAAGGDYRMAAQRVGDFLAGRASETLPETSSLTGAAPVDFNTLLPSGVAEALRRALDDLGGRLPGFCDDPAVLLGPETRASCPVRIVRERESRASVSAANLYPVGEGAGYAGGIMSSALDGLRAAEKIIAAYARPTGK